MRPKTRPARGCTKAALALARAGALKRAAAVDVTICVLLIIVPTCRCQPPPPPISSAMQQQRVTTPTAALHKNQPQIYRQHHQPVASNSRRRNDLQQELSHDELQQIIQDQQQQQQQLLLQPKAARQLFISDFVSNQSHRLLKNLVNNTLADLVASRQTAGGLTRFIQQNQRPPGGGFVQDQSNDESLLLSPNSQLARQPEGPGRPYLPAIGQRLYSFLFPNQAQPGKQFKMLGDSASFAHNSNELIEPSSSDTMDSFYDSASTTDSFGARTNAKQPAKREPLPRNAGKFISLSAPYEQLNSATATSLPVTGGAFDLAPHESKWRRERSNETFVAYPEEEEQNRQLAASYVENNQEEEPTRSVAMMQEASRPEMSQSVQQAAAAADADEEQMSMDSDGGGNHQSGGEFKFVDSEQQQGSSSNSLEQENQSLDFSNNQLDHSNDSRASETSVNVEPGSSQESFFHQLPSSYDSPMRVPPEGYYDDYYKLASSQTAGYETPMMESLIPDQQLTGSHHDHFASMNNDTKFESNFLRENQSDRPSGDNSIGANQLSEFYMNQQPLRQNDVNTDQRVEFMAPNRTTSSTASNHAGSPSNASSSVPSRGFGEQQHQAPRYTENNVTRYAHHTGDQDNIQLILANTNSSFDPINNEKVINYISEGQNVTFQPSSSKSPRHTFVNKDMNELPPATPDGIENHQINSSSSSYQDKTPIQVSSSQVSHTSTTTPSSYYVSDGDNYQTRRPSTVGEFYLPSREYDDTNGKQVPPITTQASHIALNSNNSDEIEPNYATRIDEEPSTQATFAAGGDNSDDAETLRRLSMETGQNYGQYNRGAADDRRSSLTRQGKNKSRKVNDEKFRAEGKNRNRNHHNESNRKRRQNMRHQPSMRRPQVTQAHFDPKDLILSVPTPQPSVTESAVETITELPSKVKKLRDNHPDKNELMNELLTALDRVKVAIYKLQPLTAKMNAIYRKSVTSNTRDTVLDNNKGTYAKRYPPGDYDDSYDRLHPSELLVSRSNPSASSRKGRRAARTSPTRHPRRMLADDELAEESATVATYLPPPSGMIAKSVSNNSVPEVALFDTTIHMESDLGEFPSDEIIATGIGHRMGDGRLKGEVVSFGLVGDDDNLRERLADQFANAPQEAINGSSPAAAVSADDLESSPSFGYRIMIYRSPADDADGDEEQQVVSGIIGSDETTSASDRLSYSIGTENSPTSNDNDDEEEDLMVTSESSLVEATSEPNMRNATETRDHSASDTDEGEVLIGDESKEKEKKKKSEKWKKEKEKKEKEGKKQEKSQKSQEKKKKADEESKKKKEYKKIKHNKGLVSKESKKMHRDKHIKAHDRGAAKEKALKERTQIEFFEREQIVDDEFEKGKKSTMKAGWQSGHEAKKSTKDISGGGDGDSMSMGGSHFVAHEHPASFSEKGHGSSVESSSGKKSNKFEKKNMESKGKKFKGWREKGYKIITETEFIDRGSLHDSAYKKRDKGAAHHQKYKKQEASSEGHHGSMQEHHKKSHKKEEKKEKMQEKHSKKGEAEEKKKEKGEKEKKKKKMMEKGKEKEEADGEESMLAATIRPSDEVIELMNRNQRSRQPILVSPNAYHFVPNRMIEPNRQQSPTLSRLLNVDHDSESPARFAGQTAERTHSLRLRQNATGELDQPQQQSIRQESVINGPASLGSEGAHRRSDVTTKNSIQPLQKPNNASAQLDIVDNFTGQKMNKTRVGTYVVDDQTTRPINGDQKQQAPKLQQAIALTSKVSMPEFRTLRPPSAGIQQQQLIYTTTTSTTTTTQRPKQPGNKPADNNASNRTSELQKLISLLRAEQTSRLQPEQPDSKRRLDLFSSPNNLANTNQHLMAAIAAQINTRPPPNRQSNSFGIAAAQAFLQQLAQRAFSSSSTAAAASTNSNLKNPSEFMDFSGNSFAPPQDHMQASFLPQTQLLPLPASDYPQTSFFSPPAGQFEFGPSSSQQGNSFLFSNEQLLDYEPDTILPPSSQSSFATD